MRARTAVYIAITLAVSVLAAADIDMDAAKREEARECVACHALRLIHAQRLSKAAWGRELDKMAGWGTQIANRDLLLEYLASEYSDAKPIPQAPLSSDGTGARK